MESATGESGSARSSETYDIVVVGGGVAGCFAAATAADQGADVVQLQNGNPRQRRVTSRVATP